MRLEEWQKFIESQFLEDAAKPAAKKEPPITEDAAPPLAETQAPHAAAPDNGEKSVAPASDAPLRLVFEEEAETSAVVSLPIESPSAEPEIALVLEEPAASEAELAVAENETAFSTSAAAETPTPIPAFGLPPIIEANIPSFDRYFPSARIIVPNPESEAAPTDEALQEDDALPEQEPDSLAPLGAVEAAATAFAPAEETENPKSKIQNPKFGEAASRRAPRSRARYAKNVRPEPVPTGLSRTELWAKAPKHVETLLALERLEEEKEVAQFSYKRPFAEKRQELIERLLDPILSLEETARLLNVCPTTVRRYTNKGILTYYRKEPENGGLSSAGADKETRQRRFRLSDILIFLETQQTAIEEDRRAANGAVGKPPMPTKPHAAPPAEGNHGTV